MSRAEDKELVRRARADHGLLGRAAAQEVLARDDAVEHLVAGGLWREALPGVLVPSALAVTTPVLENAAHLWAPRIMLSHYSAARRDGFWVPDHPDAWVIVPFNAPQRPRPGLQVRRTKSWPDRMRLGTIEWTVPERTLIDLAGELSPKQLEAVLMSAVRHKKTTVKDVVESAAKLRTRKGVSQLLEITGLWDPKRESLLEDKLVVDVRAAAPGEVVERQVVVGDSDGRTARADVAIRRLRLAFEADGLFFHSTDAQIADDQDRDRWMAGLGWPTHRFREGALDDSLSVRRQVRAIVEQRRRDLGLAA